MKGKGLKCEEQRHLRLLSCGIPDPLRWPEQPIEDHLDAAQQLLQQALHAASAGDVGTAAAAADAAAHCGAGSVNRAQQQQQQQQQQ
uniref:Uncharacterized protein n=1 Tax=Tetradesmus obliquus TaxID=3088 RepID=A0A383W8S5_TETOB|eukprot:jgi/Sobl393_1/15797/SZX73600.1